MESISKLSKLALEMILTDPQVLSQITMESEMPKTVIINDDGSITVSRTKQKWFEWLIGADKTISFSDISVIITRVFSGIGNNVNRTVRDGLRTEFTKSVFEGSKDDLIMAWLFTYLLGFKADGDAKQDYMNKEHIANVNPVLAGVPIKLVDTNGRVGIYHISLDRINNLML